MIIEAKEVMDRAKYGEYIEKVPRTIEKFGGKYLARGGQVTVVSGDWKPARLIIVEFASMEKFHAWWRSPEYRAVVAPARAIRQNQCHCCGRCLRRYIPMKIIAFNGSPRKEWNTATLLKKALEGASSQGAQTELIHLYDLKYQGCISCFACKKKDGVSYGKCAVKDVLKPIFEKVETADAVIFGSPVYLGTITGADAVVYGAVDFPVSDLY